MPPSIKKRKLGKLERWVIYLPDVLAKDARKIRKEFGFTLSSTGVLLIKCGVEAYKRDARNSVGSS